MEKVFLALSFALIACRPLPKVPEVPVEIAVSPVNGTNNLPIPGEKENGTEWKIGYDTQGLSSEEFFSDSYMSDTAATFEKDGYKIFVEWESDKGSEVIHFECLNQSSVVSRGSYECELNATKRIVCSSMVFYILCKEK
jgi:hypothetical protein